jgi:chemotaxis methyl-accepting protein methylase
MRAVSAAIVSAWARISWSSSAVVGIDNNRKNMKAAKEAKYRSRNMKENRYVRPEDENLIEK